MRRTGNVFQRAARPYTGPPDDQLDNMVLRLRKAVDGGADESDNFDDSEEPDDPSIAFQRQCMERLIPPVHLPVLESVKVSRAWLSALFTEHNKERPDSRRAQGNIDLTKKKGVLATDLVVGNLAVEIKPKWSFLPNSTFLSDSTHPVKSQTCRFCMHSSLKANQGEPIILGYCLKRFEKHLIYSLRRLAAGRQTQIPA
ncbi:inositol-pentakisphosphate 2-kinase-domain-containing protein [Mycena floridula]|nr:inositol-pentakisphosphate 2-kinase-domain-containing protein [Mycena floridula]